MLGLKIATPEYLVIELVVVLLQLLDGVGISNTTEVGIYDVVETLNQSLIYKLVEELHLFRSILHYIGDDIF